jgi:hypothetical protein
MRASVALICMGGRDGLRSSLRALRSQQGAPELEIVAAYGPDLAEVLELQADFPEVRFVENTGQKSPLELAGFAICQTQAERVLVSKDYCLPGPHWAAQLLQTLDGPCAAAGGPVTLPSDSTPVEWAFSFLDFFPYTGQLTEAETATLTVCNAAYRRADLEGLAVDWKHHFQESAVNEALKVQSGQGLVLNTRAPVELVRHVNLQSALHERYALGRIFAAERLEYASNRQKWMYRLGAPALPALMMSRMGKKALSDPTLRADFIEGLLPLGAMVLARTWGEWLGYVSSRPPRPSSR